MKKVHLLIAVTALGMTGIASCKQQAPKGQETADSISIASNNNTVETPIPFTSDSVATKLSGEGYECKVEVDYPTSKGLLADSIRQALLHVLNHTSPTGGLSPEQPQTAFKGKAGNGKAVADFFAKAYADQLKKSYDEILKLNEDREAPAPYSFDISLKKSCETGKYVTYNVFSYSYLGGAHGSSMQYALNIAKSTGKAVGTVIDNSMTKAMQKLLRHGVAEYFKAQGETIADKDLDGHLFIDNGIIPLPAYNPELTPEGLRFVYQQYEIGPYAIGMVTFTVPYDKVKPFMTGEALELL